MLKEAKKKTKIEVLQNKIKGYEAWLQRKNADIDELREQREQLTKAIENVSRLCDCICFSLIKQFGKDDTLTVDMPKMEDTFGKKVNAVKDEKGKIVLYITDRKEETEEEGK